MMRALSPQNQGQTQTVREFVAFRTAGQDFCLDILSVREIRGYSRPAHLPHAPGYVQGVINLRGAVVPILDLAGRLGLPPLDEGARNVIIVAACGTRTVGLLVASVTDILGVADSDIQPLPDVASDASRNLLRGLILQQDRLLRVVNCDVLLQKQEGQAA